MAKANKDKGSYKAALDAMVAVGIAILLACPVRAKNLAGLDAKKHFVLKTVGKKTTYAIHIPKEEVKNRQDIDSVLTEPIGKLIREYLTHHHPVLAPAGTTALFPRPGGKLRDPGKLAELIQQRIRTHLGLTVHAHLFRHIAAMQYLDAFPGELSTSPKIGQ